MTRRNEEDETTRTSIPRACGKAEQLITRTIGIKRKVLQSTAEGSSRSFSSSCTTPHPPLQSRGSSRFRPSLRTPAHAHRLAWSCAFPPKVERQFTGESITSLHRFRHYQTEGRWASCSGLLWYGSCRLLSSNCQNLSTLSAATLTSFVSSFLEHDAAVSHRV